MPSPSLDVFPMNRLLDELHAREAASPHEGEDKPQKTTPGKRGLFKLALPDPEFAGVSSEDLIKAVRKSQKLIYGVDDRQDFHDIREKKVLDNAEGVAALFAASTLVAQPDGSWQLPTATFQATYHVCTSERFHAQPCGAFGSAFLVGEDLIATAGHCVSPNYLYQPKNLRVVFGYHMAADGTAVTRIRAEDVYSGLKVVESHLTAVGTDWALVQLDRKVTGRPILPVRRSGKVADGAPVYVLGHPCGLPLKYAPGANVRDNSPRAFFVANLDTYGGNSGSPVFGADHQVEGILVRGGTDFVSKGGCYVSLVQPQTGGRGEDVTRAAEFQHLVPVRAD